MFLQRPRTHCFHSTWCCGDDAFENSTKFTYDKAGNILSVTDVNGASIQYRYDLLNREISHKNKNGGITWKQYDKDGRIIKEIMPNAYARNGESAKGYGYTYDRLGREVGFYAPDGSLIYEKSYNPYGELKAQRDATGGGIAFGYDLGYDLGYGCKKLKNLTIGKNVVTIGDKAFTKTPKSMTVKVPKKKFKAYKSMFIKRGVNKKARFKKS